MFIVRKADRDKMKWKYLLFDLDGTITDSSEGIINCVIYALEAAGVDTPDYTKLLGFIGPPLVEGFQDIVGMTEEDARQATAKYRERYSVIGLFENKVYEGIPTLLEDLKAQGKVIALATSKPETYSIRILQHFRLMKYFDVVVGSTLEGERNHKKDVIQEVFRRMNLPENEKEKVLMIGDRKQDVEGAKTCGISCAGVYYGFAEKGELEAAGADYIAEDVEALRKLIL